MTTALSGNTAMFGKFDPYLTDVELHEHCFIHGPKGCQVEAIQLYIRISKFSIL